MQRENPQTSLSLGWEAARANAVPAFILQAAMVALLVAYYFSPATAAALNRIAEYKKEHALIFVVLAAIAAGALLPELFVIFFFQKGRVHAQNFRNLAFTVPTWAIDGILVDLMYRGFAIWLGDVVTLPVVVAKVCLDMFGYNPFFAAPSEVLVYEWKNTRISWASLRRALTWEHYRDKIVPTLLATWAVWIPLVAVIYSVPLALQFPLFSLALTFWVLILTYMTNKFSGQIAANAPVALSVAEM